MDTLSCPNRMVEISEAILTEDSTHSAISLSLRAVLQQLDAEKTKHHDYLVALLLIFLAESGFYTLPTSEFSDNSSRSSFDNSENKSKGKYWNTRIVHIPNKWKSQDLGQYEIYFVLLKTGIRSKLIVKPMGDRVILNMYPYIENKKVYSMIIKTLLYVNPHTNNLSNRYRNLKDLSHRFKNNVATPVRTDIFYSLKLTNPSLQGLPLEIILKIKQFLNGRDLKALMDSLDIVESIHHPKSHPKPFRLKGLVKKSKNLNDVT
ncbi:PREDICTED: uncharacterized protein LOC106747667 [Dinoponera quadriceps]|uniref:Uncharacterized protein LOC106747667 n=1 Tax=Dinoponera quadriceps TaxID=609295 RepID=A0A6P3XRP0_DINQU|nr:PREDICTED: uncharacterized protein LOC106747667 [Dinoponera quadriceps]XP_014480907.1 PREDICTED: uncharacterized protein LOC106747667 [Dinoponera quadriceps]XP_014480908.1 PREDICTED: uncharacterized protein LOC106747667 [Dinoponera quadriceps]XP_014480909.1 PREDICTED: uncharacterized protein LOC106747667 [Dinoponera quadriceps]